MEIVDQSSHNTNFNCDQEHNEIFQIASSYAIVDEWTVVVEDLNTLATSVTVFAPLGFAYLASVRCYKFLRSLPSSLGTPCKLDYLLVDGQLLHILNFF